MKHKNSFFIVFILGLGCFSLEAVKKQKKIIDPCDPVRAALENAIIDQSQNYEMSVDKVKNFFKNYKEPTELDCLKEQNQKNFEILQRLVETRAEDSIKASLEIFNELIGQGMHADQVDENKRNLFHWAAGYGRDDMVLVIADAIKKNGSEVKDFINAYDTYQNKGWTPAHYVVADHKDMYKPYGGVKFIDSIVKALVDVGADFSLQAKEIDINPVSKVRTENSNGTILHLLSDSKIASDKKEWAIDTLFNQISEDKRKDFLGVENKYKKTAFETVMSSDTIVFADNILDQMLKYKVELTPNMLFETAKVYGGNSALKKLLDSGLKLRGNDGDELKGGNLNKTIMFYAIQSLDKNSVKLLLQKDSELRISKEAVKRLFSFVSLGATNLWQADGGLTYLIGFAQLVINKFLESSHSKEDLDEVVGYVVDFYASTHIDEKEYLDGFVKLAKLLMAKGAQVNNIKDETFKKALQKILGEEKKLEQEEKLKKEVALKTLAQAKVAVQNLAIALSQI